MWESGADRSVTCIACGTELPRSEAREYDKYGDRWEREGKEFEYVCKPCFRSLTKAPRRSLEADLVAAGAGECADEDFLGAFLAAARRESERE